MSRRSIVILAVLVILGVWGLRHAFESTPVVAAGTHLPSKAFCPRFGLNPPQRLPVVHDAVSISFDGSRLVAVDRQGRVWSYYRGESNCDDPAPIKVLDAAIVAKQHLGTGAPRAVERSAVLLDGTALAAVDLGMPNACATAGNICATAPSGGFDNVTALAAGDRHRLLVRGDGSLWSSGMNECGQLGRAGASGSLVDFRQVPGMDGIVAVAAGMRSSMALDAKGTVYTWGNLSNPLFSSPVSSPVAGNPYCPYQDQTWAGHLLSGASDDYPREVRGLPRIEQVASYYASDLALDTAGQVWGWGYNSCGQLGVDPGQGPERIEYYLEQPRRIEDLPPIRAIAAGKRHALALDGNGQVWAWGENADTELGQRLGLGQHGSPACENEYGRGERAPFTELPRQVPGIGKAVAIAAGYNSSAAIDAHGDVWVWGRH